MLKLNVEDFAFVGAIVDFIITNTHYEVQILTFTR